MFSLMIGQYSLNYTHPSQPTLIEPIPHLQHLILYVSIVVMVTIYQVFHLDMGKIRKYDYK